MTETFNSPSQLNQKSDSQPQSPPPFQVQSMVDPEHLPNQKHQTHSILIDHQNVQEVPSHKITDQNNHLVQRVSIQPITQDQFIAKNEESDSLEKKQQTEIDHQKSTILNQQEEIVKEPLQTINSSGFQQIPKEKDNNEIKYEIQQTIQISTQPANQSQITIQHEKDNHKKQQKIQNSEGHEDKDLKVLKKNISEAKPQGQNAEKSVDLIQAISQPASQIKQQKEVYWQILIEGANDLKNDGNKEFKLMNITKATEKYQEGLRLLDPNRFYGASQSECRKMAELSAVLLYNIGMCYFTISRWKQAEALFTEAIVINPSYNKAIYKRALARYELQDYENSMVDIKNAFNNDKSNQEIHQSYDKIRLKYNEENKKHQEELKKFSAKGLSNDSLKKSQSSIKETLIHSPNNQEPENGKDTSASWWNLTPLLIPIAFGLYKGYQYFRK